MQPRRELRLAPELLDLDAELRQRLLRRVARVLGIAEQMARELLHARRMPFAERLESPRIAVFRSFHQDRITQPRIRKRPFRMGGLLDLTPAPAWQLHLSALV